jgi:hypothetical protein
MTRPKFNANRWYIAGTVLIGASVFCFIQHGVDMERQFQRKLRDTWAEATDLNEAAAARPEPKKE